MTTVLGDAGSGATRSLAGSDASPSSSERKTTCTESVPGVTERILVEDGLITTTRPLLKSKDGGSPGRPSTTHEDARLFASPNTSPASGARRPAAEGAVGFADRAAVSSPCASAPIFLWPLSEDGTGALSA